MSVSAKVPLTVTYTPTSGGAASTVTVLGQVLNNGATNWVAASSSSDQAIYLDTSSENGDPTTVLGGTTYWLTPGPALPDQATGVTGSGSAMTSSGSGMPASTTANHHHTSGGFSLSSMTSSASASQTSSSNGAERHLRLSSVAGALTCGLLLLLTFGDLTL